MSSYELTPTGHRPLTHRTDNARSRQVRDRAMTGMMALAVLLALIPLALILFEVIRQGLPQMNWEFLSSTQPASQRRPGGGYFHGLVGTLYMVVIATGLTVPLGVGAAVFLVEYKESRLTGPIRFFTDVMTGVPSIFVGLFIYAGIVQTGFGFGTMAGALSLAVLMLPIVVRSAEEILKLVPDDLRNASYGLGARRWQTVTKVVLPAARPGLITGTMLAVARAVGETAPLILTAFGAVNIVWAFTGKPQAALPLLVYKEARTFLDVANQRAWAGALELIVLVLVLTIAARWVSARAGSGRR